MDFSKNKKGQGMSTNTIVLLILGVTVLVILILGFTMGWNRVAPFLTSSNVDNIVNTCQSACSTQAKYDYCSAPRELRDAEGNTVKTTCAVLATEDSFELYGIRECPNIDCNLDCNKIKINDIAGNPDFVEGLYDVSSLAVEETCFITA